MPSLSPFRLHGKAPLLIALIVGLLALPPVVGLIDNNAQAIRTMEHRDIAAWPPLRLLQSNAPEFIEASEAWIKDNIGFRFQANALYQKLRLGSFRNAPQPNITIGLDGHVFLNSADATKPYLFFEALCLEQANPSPEMLQTLDATLAAATRLFRRRGAQVTFAIVPATPSLYADKIPLSLPGHYRSACLTYSGKDHALARLQRQGESTDRYRIFYPYSLFTAHKDEPYFWPKERFHWEGRSAYLFARHLLKASGVIETLLLDDAAKIVPVDDDLAGFFGFSRPVSAYVYPYTGQPLVRITEPWARGFSRKETFSHLLTKGSLSDKSALMVANSFGGMIVAHLARGFRHLYTLDTNWLMQEEQATVLATVIEHIRPDYVYFVFDDQNVGNLPEWLASFVELERQDARPLAAPPGAKSSSPEKSGR